MICSSSIRRAQGKDLWVSLCSTAVVHDPQGGDRQRFPEGLRDDKKKKKKRKQEEEKIVMLAVL